MVICIGGESSRVGVHMSLSGLSLTNQRLFFVRLQIQQFEALTAGESEPARQAQYESVVFHLLQAYCAFLRELADMQNLPVNANALVENAEGLISNAPAEVVSPELQELAMLEMDPGSWLANLRQVFRRFGAPVDTVGLPGVVQHSEISVTMVTPEDNRLSELTMWHEALSEIIRRLRAVSQEW